MLEVLEIDRIFGWGAGNDVVFIIIVASERSELFCVGELDVNPILLHDALDAAASNANDTFVIRFRDMERYLSGKLFLEKREALEDRRIGASNIDEEVVVVESLEFDFDVRSLHDLVNLPILLATDELSMLVRKLDLEANLVMERLRRGMVIGCIVESLQLLP